MESIFKIDLSLNTINYLENYILNILSIYYCNKYAYISNE